MFVLSVVFVFRQIYSSGLSLPLFSEKARENISVNQPNLYKVVAPILTTLSYFKVENHYFRQIELSQWSGVGANNKYSSKLINDQIALSGINQKLRVYSTSELIQALKTVQAGQTIILAPGEYHITANRITIGQGGTAAKPIHLTALELGSVKIFLKGEGFVVNKPFWQFSNLHFIGNCKRHTQCEHAFHVVGQGHHTVIKNSIMQDFNAMIKVNGVGEHYPDYGKVTQNTFFNSTARKTANPVTPFDLMHANYWQVSDNFIFDIQKSAGNKVSYAAFFKGGSEHGIFERNLVICAANLPDKYTAIGLSLGGGGSAKRHRRNQNSAEHVGGVIRNNIIMHCSNDVGIYLNRSRDSLIEHNILYNTLGIDIRYPESDAKVVNNIISGRIKIRDNGKLFKSKNLVVSRNFITGEDSLSDYFVAPDIGDFTLKGVSNTDLSINSPVKSTGSITFDFCGATPNNLYLGAYAAMRFCLEKLNINNKANGE
ncbi:MAG: right-handed parallel beta-helix repeat-containing protein [Colwellia sp.]|nr:right-handed parallel beta-helix repeat-containing protein [Colwellia sp.]